MKNIKTILRLVSFYRVCAPYFIMEWHCKLKIVKWNLTITPGRKGLYEFHNARAHSTGFSRMHNDIVCSLLEVTIVLTENKMYIYKLKTVQVSNLEIIPGINGCANLMMPDYIIQQLQVGWTKRNSALWMRLHYYWLQILSKIIVVGSVNGLYSVFIISTGVHQSRWMFAQYKLTAYLQLSTR